MTFVPCSVSFLVDNDRFRLGGRPSVTKVRVEFGSGSCCRGTVDNAATVGRPFAFESVVELEIANVAELSVPNEGSEADIVVRNHNYGADNL